MEESSKRRETTAGRHRHGTFGSTAPSQPSGAPNRSLSLFSTASQHERYTNLFSTRDILDLKNLYSKYFENESFNCYEVFKTYELADFMTLKLPYYLELVRVFYSNLQITDGVIRSEVYKTHIVIYQTFFYSLTKLKSQGVPFEGSVVEDWK